MFVSLKKFNYYLQLLLNQNDSIKNNHFKILSEKNKYFS